MSTWTATTDSEYVHPCPTDLRKVSSSISSRHRNARKFPMIQMGFDISNNAVATHQSSYAMSFAPMPSRFNVHFKPGVHFSSLSPISVGHTTALQTRQATKSAREARVVRQSLEVEILWHGEALELLLQLCEIHIHGRCSGHTLRHGEPMHSRRGGTRLRWRVSRHEGSQTVWIHSTHSATIHSWLPRLSTANTR